MRRSIRQPKAGHKAEGTYPPLCRGRLPAGSFSPTGGGQLRCSVRAEALYRALICPAAPLGPQPRGLLIREKADNYKSGAPISLGRILSRAPCRGRGALFLRFGGCSEICQIGAAMLMLIASAGQSNHQERYMKSLVTHTRPRTRAGSAGRQANSPRNAFVSCRP